MPFPQSSHFRVIVQVKLRDAWEALVELGNRVCVCVGGGCLYGLLTVQK